MSGAPLPPPRKQKPSNGRVPVKYYGSPEKIKDIINEHNGKIGRYSDVDDDNDNINDGVDILSTEDESDSNELENEDEDEDLNFDSSFTTFIDDVLESEIPESVVGEDVNLRGELQFSRLLRINGKFNGKLVSYGNLVVGPKGSYIGNISTLENVVVSGGRIEGNIIAEYVAIKNQGTIIGNISCKSLRVVGGNNVIIGKVNINPLAPEVIDEHGDLIIIEDENENIIENNNVEISPVFSKVVPLHEDNNRSRPKDIPKPLKINNINDNLNYNASYLNASYLNANNNGSPEYQSEVSNEEKQRLKAAKKAKKVEMKKRIEEEEAAVALARDKLLKMKS